MISFSFRRICKKAKIYLAFLGLISCRPVFSNPKGMHISSGNAVFTDRGNGLVEIKADHGAILNWERFSIDKGEITRFIQTNSKSSVLNRVISNNPSALLGTLEANGKVFLINQNGILVGEGARINVGSFIASTFDILNEDFLRDGEINFAGTSKSSIVNLGTIQAIDGDVVLIAYHIDNQGKIETPKGVTALGVGEDVLLKPTAKERILIRPKKREGSEKEGTGLTHSGHIEAIQAELKADGNAYAMGINTEGTIEATGVEKREGRILLIAEGGVAQVYNGSLISKNEGEKGGEVQVLGDSVYLLSETKIDVSGKKGGGVALIGGDKKGQNPDILNASEVYVGQSVNVNASALEEGNGGKVIYWGTEGNQYYGSTHVKGGEKSGDGGLVEISSLGSRFDPKGYVNTVAPKGKTGDLLLDPVTVTISTGVDTNYTTPPPYNLTFTQGGTGASNINTGSLSSYLTSSNVIVDATQTLATGPQGNGSITVQNNIGWNSPFSLTLNAFTIVVGTAANPVTVSNSGTGAIIMNASTSIAIGGAGFNQTTVDNFSTSVPSGTPAVQLTAPIVTIGDSTHTMQRPTVVQASSGDLVINASNSLSLYGGNGNAGFGPNGQISHVGTPTSGSIKISGGSVLLQAGQSNSSGANAVIATNGAPIQIGTASSPLTGNCSIIGGTSSLSSTANAEIIGGIQAGNIQIYTLGDISFTGGTATSGGNSNVSLFSSGAGSANFILSGKNVNVLGGSVDSISSSSALIQTLNSIATGTIGVTATETLTLKAGTGAGNTSSQIATGASTGINTLTISANAISLDNSTSPNIASPASILTNNGDITISLQGNMTLKAGANPGSEVFISANNAGGAAGNISIVGSVAPTTLLIQGGTAPGTGDASAKITSFAGTVNFSLPIAGSSVQINAGINPASNSILSAFINTEAGGSIIGNVNGNYVITAGAAGSGGSSIAGIFGATSSGVGSISLTGNNFQLQGGRGSSTNESGEISIGFPGSTTQGTISITAQSPTGTLGNVTLLGGTSASVSNERYAFIRTQATQGNNKISVTTASLTMDNSLASILSGCQIVTRNGDIAISLQGLGLLSGGQNPGTDSSIVAGGPGGASPGNLSITTPTGSVSPSTLTLNGGTALSGKASALIETFSGGNINISLPVAGSNIRITGGIASSPSSADLSAAIATFNNGSLTTTIGGDYTLIGGSTTTGLAFAGILADVTGFSGNLSVAGRNFILTGGTGSSLTTGSFGRTEQAEIGTGQNGFFSSGTVSVTASGTVTLAGGSGSPDTTNFERSAFVRTFGNSGNNSITLATQGLTLQNSTAGVQSSVQIVTAHQGDINVILGGGLSLNAGAVDGTFAQILSNGNGTFGNISITSTGSAATPITLVGGTATSGQAYAAINVNGSGNSMDIELPNAGSDINLDGGIPGSGTANVNATIQISSSGSLTCNVGGSFTALGGTVGIGGTAVAALMVNSSDSLTTSASSYTLTGGGAGGSSEAEIFNNGPINLTTPGEISLISGVGGPALISSGGNNTISCGSLQMNSSGNASTSVTGSDVNITVAESISLTGGNGTFTTSTIFAFNNVTIQGANSTTRNSCNLSGGSATSGNGFASIVGNGGVIINFLAPGSTINLVGGFDNGVATNTGLIYALIQGGTGGCTINVNGDYSIDGGQTGNGGQAYARILGLPGSFGPSPPPSFVNLKGRNFSLSGGRGVSNTSFSETADITVGNPGFASGHGTITINATGSIILNGGQANASTNHERSSFIQTLGTTNDNSITITTNGLTLQESARGVANNVTSAIQTVSGSIHITNSGDTSLFGGSGTSDSMSISSGGTSMGITLSTVNLTVNRATTTGVNSFAQISTQNGDIAITSSGGTISLHGGAANGTYSLISAGGNGSVSIDPPLVLNIVGSLTVGVTGAYAQIATANDDIDITVDGNSFLTGGAGIGNTALISAGGIGSVNFSAGGNITLQGGSTDTTQAQIVAAGSGDVKITGTNTCVLSLLAGSTSGTGDASASIATTSGGQITVNLPFAGSNCILTAGTSSGGGNVSSTMQTIGGGNITSTINGNYSVTAKSSTTTGSALAGFYAGFTSGGGNLSLSGNNYTLNGGTGTSNLETAEIRSGVGGGTITLTASGSITLNAGTAVSTNQFQRSALIRTLGTTGDNSITVTNTNGLFLNGSTNAVGSFDQAVISTVNGDIKITNSGDTTLQAGIAPSSSALISANGVGAGGVGRVLTLSSENLSILGSTAPTGTNAVAQISTSNGDITITPLATTVITATVDGSSATIQSNGNGNIFFNPQGNVTILGGTPVNTATPAGIIAAGTGNVNVTSSESLTLSMTGGNPTGTGDAVAVIQTVNGGNVAINLTENSTNISLTGGTLGTGSSGSASAAIRTLNNGSVTCNIVGNYTIQAGTLTDATATGFSQAGIFAAYLTGTGSVATSGNNYSVTGGTSVSGAVTTDAVTAEIRVSNPLQSQLGTIAVTATGAMTLTGGPAFGNNGAYIRTFGSSGNNSITIGCTGLTLQGSLGATSLSSPASITTVSGNIQITNQGDTKLAAGSQSGNIATIIAGGSNRTITMTTNKLDVLGSTSVTGTNAYALIQTQSGNISITTFDATHVSGGAATGATASITSGTIGNIQFFPSGDITISGGTISNTQATMTASGTGSISILGGSGQNLILNGGTAPSGDCYAKINTVSGGSITINLPILGSTCQLLAGAGGTSSFGNSSALIDTDTGGDISITITGAYSLLAGSNSGLTGLAQAGVITGYTSGSGNIVMKGGAYTLTAGSGTSSGLYAETAEIRTGSGSSANTINLTATGLMQVNAGTAVATALNDARSAFIRTTGSSFTGNNSITITTAGLSVNGSTTAGADFARAMITTTSGDITVTNTADTSFTGGVGISTTASMFAQGSGTLGNITFITTNNLFINSLAATGLNAFAEIRSQIGNVNITAQALTNMQGGVGQGTYAEIVTGGSGSINLTTFDLNLMGGVGLNAYARIDNNLSPITITCNDMMRMMGGSGLGTVANIFSLRNIVTATTAADLFMSGGTNTNVFAQIGVQSPTQSPSDINLTVGGNVRMFGNSVANTYSLIGHGNPVATSIGQSLTGNINISSVGSDLTMQGGSGANAFAQIGNVNNVANAVSIIDNITIGAVGGRLVMNAGTGAGSYALIGQGGQANSFVGSADSYNGSISVTANEIDMNGPAIDNSFAVIGFANPGSATGAAVTCPLLSVTSATNIEMTTGISTLSDAGIGAYFPDDVNTVVMITNLNVTSLGNLELLGPNMISSVQPSSFIGMHLLNGTGAAAVSVSVGDTLNMFSGPFANATTSQNNAFITNANPNNNSSAPSPLIIKVGKSMNMESYGGGFVQTFSSGTSNIIVGNNLSMTVNALGGGPVSILSNQTSVVDVNQNITMQGQGISPAVIENLNAIPSLGALTVYARNGNLNMNGLSAIQNQANMILAIVGKSITVSNTSNITSANGRITLVLDNLNPTSPNIGAGIQFNLLNSSSITAGGGVGAVLIYSTTQPLTTIDASSTINGATFVKGPEFVNSPTEAWGIYYANGSLAGNSFRVFYKDTGIPPIPPTPPTPPTPPNPNGPAGLRYLAALLNSQMLFNQDWEWDDYRYYNIEFTVGYDKHKFKIREGFTQSFEYLSDESFVIERHKRFQKNILLQTNGYYVY